MDPDKRGTLSGEYLLEANAGNLPEARPGVAHVDDEPVALDASGVLELLDLCPREHIPMTKAYGPGWRRPRNIVPPQ